MLTPTRFATGSAGSFGSGAFKARKVKNVWLEGKRGCLRGKFVAMTGEFENLSKDTLKERIIDLGAQYQLSVNAKTNVLVYGYTTQTGGEASQTKKYVDAERFRQKGRQIRILSEEEFWGWVKAL